MASNPLKRCAVYTRKSSEEGLEQDFNSLQAQREACEAYISSQRGEGWKLIPTAYDDGGISGGTMDRPSLQKLLADIALGKIDVVVVYKVDRLTRALSDFAKIVEVFDAKGVSFVSVTQQFNTTSSMGRLTLNVLLSFAQFEREVTGERIRDKIAASKKKGLWMGGTIPLGYRVEDRKLIPVAEEVDRVREIYQRYLTVPGVRTLTMQLNRDGIRPKSNRTKFSRGALYVLLSNPLYIGEIQHKENRYAGQHPGIVDRKLWDEVQAKLASNAVRTGFSDRKTDSSPLMGKIFDEHGRLLTPSHTAKGSRRYRYYVSPPNEIDQPDDRPWRLPAGELEQRIEDIAKEALLDKGAITEAALHQGLPESDLPALFRACRDIKDRLATVIKIHLNSETIRVLINLPSPIAIQMEKTILIQLRRRGVESKLVIKAPNQGNLDPVMIRSVGQALKWWEELQSGKVQTAAEIAVRDGLKQGFVQRILRLAFLAPDIQEAISKGMQPAELTTFRLLQKIELPLSWADQRKALGFA